MKLMNDEKYQLNLIYTPPSEEEALEWMRKGGDNVSGFACCYPGRYAEAAELARKVLKISLDNEEDK